MMSPTSTLEYGYATGRHDPPTALVPADQPVARNVAPTKDEGRQAEKVIKGMFTGSFNFEVSITAPANKTVLKLTGSTSHTSALFALDIRYTVSTTAADTQVIRVTVPTGFPSANQYFATFFYSSEIRFRIDAWGGVRGASSNIVQVNNPVFTFNAATSSGMGLNTSGSGAIILYGPDIALEIGRHQAGRPRVLFTGISNTFTTPFEPLLTHATWNNIGLWWGGTSTQQRVAVVSGPAPGAATTSWWNGLAIANQSWTLVTMAGGIQRASSGTHPRLSLLEMEVITGGVAAALVTDTTTLYIAGAPNFTVTGGKRRAIWVRSDSTTGGLVEFEGQVAINATFTPAVGASGALVNVAGTLTEQTSGNHPRLSLIEFAALGVTAGAATVADATTVYIAGPPTATVTGKNRALWVVAGESEFGGTVSIAENLEVHHQDANAEINSTGYGTGTGTLHARRARGTRAAPSAVLAGDILGGVGGRAYHSGGAFQTSSPASIHFVAQVDQTAADFGMWIRFLTTPSGSTVRVERGRWTHDGDLVIGSSTNAPLLAGRGVAVVHDQNAEFSAYSYGTDTLGSGFRGFRARGTFAVPSAAIAGDGMFVGLIGYDGTTHLTSSRALIVLAAAENWSNTQHGTVIRFELVALGTTVRGERARLYGDGGLHIGTTFTVPPVGGLRTEGQILVEAGGCDITGTLVVRGVVDGLGEVNTFGVSGATGARLRLRYFYTASPADPPQDMADLMIVDTGAATLFRVRYNDAGTMKVGDLALV